MANTVLNKFLAQVAVAVLAWGAPAFAEPKPDVGNSIRLDTTSSGTRLVASVGLES